MKTKAVIFDLDDTLTFEIDFLKSAYLEIAQHFQENEYDTMLQKYYNGEDVFQYLANKYHCEKSSILQQYRNHFPTINLIDGAQEVLTFCRNQNFYLGLITDGRSVTQRNKMKALQIENIFHKIIISEEFGTAKPNKANYEIFIDQAEKFYYIGDNVSKDFLVPNQLGWETICYLDQGKHIHKQNWEIEVGYQPKYTINNLKEIIEIITTT